MRLGIPLFAALLLAACDVPLRIAEPDEERRILGTLEFYNDPVRVELPARATRGEEFVVTVLTYGGGCMRQGDTEVDVDGLTATIRPFDFAGPPDAICTADLKLYRHEARIRFDRAGTATLFIQGRRLPGGYVFVAMRTLTIE